MYFNVIRNISYIETDMNLKKEFGHHNSYDRSSAATGGRYTGRESQTAKTSKCMNFNS